MTSQNQVWTHGDPSSEERYTTDNITFQYYVTSGKKQHSAFSEEESQFPNGAIPIRVEVVAVDSPLYVQQWATGSTGAGGAS